MLLRFDVRRDTGEGCKNHHHVTRLGRIQEEQQITHFNIHNERTRVLLIIYTNKVVGTTASKTP